MLHTSLYLAQNVGQMRLKVNDQTSPLTDDAVPYKWMNQLPPTLMILYPISSLAELSGLYYLGVKFIKWLILSLREVWHLLFFAESDIPMVGNVFSFVLTKYPPEWRWSLIKVCSSFCQFSFLQSRWTMGDRMLTRAQYGNVGHQIVISVWFFSCPFILTDWLFI